MLLALSSCKQEEPTEPNKVDEIITSIKETYAPDKRIAVFDIQSDESATGYVIKGKTNLPEALEAFKNELESGQIKYVDSIEMLPSENLEGKVHGVIVNSVANLRSNPSHSSELVTQATLGMPLNVYQKDGGWYQIQTPDNYLGWVDGGGLQLMDQTEFNTWKLSDKLLFTKIYGNAYAETNTSSQVVSDLVAGSVLNLISEKDAFYEVQYPDGRSGFVQKSEAMPFQDWKSALNFTEEGLVETSKTMLGVPYLWGGTSIKGVDCSGFTKTIYFMNGMIIPRDASQQVHEGTLVDDSKAWDQLIPGDLLFFGRKATDSSSERVVHVGMWIGNNEFIHSSGKVRISSVDPEADNFDEFNYDRYLRTKRILNETDEGLIYLTKSDIF